MSHSHFYFFSFCCTNLMCFLCFTLFVECFQRRVLLAELRGLWVWGVLLCFVLLITWESHIMHQSHSPLSSPKSALPSLIRQKRRKRKKVRFMLSMGSLESSPRTSRRHQSVAEAKYVPVEVRLHHCWGSSMDRRCQHGLLDHHSGPFPGGSHGYEAC